MDAITKRLANSTPASENGVNNGAASVPSSRRTLPTDAAEVDAAGLEDTVTWDAIPTPAPAFHAPTNFHPFPTK